MSDTDTYNTRVYCSNCGEDFVIDIAKGVSVEQHLMLNKKCPKCGCNSLKRDYSCFERKKSEQKEYWFHGKHRGSFDYSLSVLNPDNNDTTFGQFRDCAYTAIEILDERVKDLEEKDEFSDKD